MQYSQGPPYVVFGRHDRVMGSITTRLGKESDKITSLGNSISHLRVTGVGVHDAPPKSITEKSPMFFGGSKKNIAVVISHSVGR